jgi:hypothetical protein
LPCSRYPPMNRLQAAAVVDSVRTYFAEFRILGQKHEDGYGWHIHELKSGEKTYRVFAARSSSSLFLSSISLSESQVAATVSSTSGTDGSSSSSRSTSAGSGSPSAALVNNGRMRCSPSQQECTACFQQEGMDSSAVVGKGLRTATAPFRMPLDQRCKPRMIARRQP